MTPKIVTNFRRSLSFPDELPSNTITKPQKNLHVRSASLPCRSHPIISQLRDEISEIESWYDGAGRRTTVWICDGLKKLKSVQESLDDLLLIPQTRESLHGDCSGLIERFLEDFLKLVDGYGIFQMQILRLKEEYSSAHIALRRKNESKIDVHSKNLSKIGKEIGKLVCSVTSIGKLAPPVPARGSKNDEEVDIVEIINGVVRATVLVSTALFGGISGSLVSQKTSSFGFGRKTRNTRVEGGIYVFEEIKLEDLVKEDAKILSKKMHNLEDCIVEIEGCGGKVFRSLINSRVSLLNVLTQ